MNRSFIVAVLTVTMIIMMSTAGYAVIYPHEFYCDNCHGLSSGSTAAAINNACVGCHATLGEASRMPVNADAMANFHGSVSGQPATGSRSTHTWGAASTNPAAAVQEPLNTVLNVGYGNVDLTGSVLCIRCHDAKANDNSTPGVNKPYLRATNVNDALCLDCHRTRSTNTHTTGSHPVANKIYSSVYKSNTTAFRRTPLSPNQYNSTAKLGNYLSNGKIVCSTCHAPHYADSNSATLGNRSTANGFAQDDTLKGLKGSLQNSKGQLLRTDPIGATATSINVCSSCHKETRNLNHNGKSQNIQCDHCHGAHVDYTGDGSAPNIYLVRRNFSNMSTDKVKLGSNVKVLFKNNTGFKRADGMGVCQICHTLPTTIEAHTVANALNSNCKDCHKHENGFSASNCASCHGQPPMTNIVGGPNGKSSKNYALDESYTPHATHADAGYYKYACKNCHYDGVKAGYHNTGSSFTDVFVDTTGSVGDQPGLSKNISGDYTTATKTCANVYCHSNGNPRVTGIAWKSAQTPSWENGRSKILGQADECITCHESGATLITNAHYTHVTTNNIKCFVCHNATVTVNDSIADRTKHANGTKDVSFAVRPLNFISTFEASFNKDTATCTNSCHTNGLGFASISTARWTESFRKGDAYCGSCHAKVPTTSLHPTHLTGDNGPKLGTDPSVCDSCHVYSAGASTHANGVVNLRAGNSCAPCHPGGAPVWATGATVTCESCHVGSPTSVVGVFTAPAKNNNSSIGHGKYSTATVNKVVCTSCHNSSAPHIGAGASEKRLSVAGNANCTTCHIKAKMGLMTTARADLLTHGVSYSGSVNTFKTYTTTNDFRARECAGCHDTHGTTNLMSIRTTINGQSIVYTDRSVGFFVTSSMKGTNSLYNGLCQVCHTKTKYFRNNAPPSLSEHADKNCLDCHWHKPRPDAPIIFAFQGGGGCGKCHGYPPVRSEVGLKTADNYLNAKLQDYSGGGGAHTVAGHVSRSVIEGGSWSNCTNCHFDQNHHKEGGTSVQKAFVNVVVNPKFKFNNATSIVYNASTCSNVSCHFKPSPNWTNGLQ